MAVDGAVVSEVPLGTSPRRELFPLRNRIISGLCRGVIVVEARRRSGSLITVRHALDEGRDVFVVPGPSEGPFAEGSNRLLREGAIAVTGPEDVLEDLGVREAFGEAGAFEGAKGEKSTRAGGKSAGLDPLAMRLLEALDGGPCSREQLLAAVDAAPGAMAASLLDLELSGRIREERDGRIHRV